MRGRLGVVALLIAFAPAAIADTPGHNPDLDHKCKPGFQWSRLTVACEQANCPPGSKRTYTLECNCGEAWNKPFRTCHENYLATHCVAKGQSCENTPSGFDPITGGCKTGYDKDSAGVCQPSFPEQLTCTVTKLDGTPVTNAAVTFVELEAGHKTGTRTWVDAQQLSTGADGSITARVANRQTGAVRLRVRGIDGYPAQMLTIPITKQPDQCELEVVNTADVERFVKDEYADLLAGACVDQASIDAVRGVQFRPNAGVDTPQYDAENKVIKFGSVGDNWNDDELTMFHEFGHAISDKIIDPTSWYFKGYPFSGKYVGGAHDNWVPNEQKDGWGPDVDAEELAFEEGLADFLAMLYYASKGRVYQNDFSNDAAALAALQKNGRTTGSRTEGIVTRYLWELYADDIAKGPAGAAKVMGDLIKTITYEKRNSRWGYPARTIKQFIASKARRDKAESDACSVKGPKLGKLNRKFGFAPGSAVHLDATGGDEAARQRVRDAAAALGWKVGDGAIELERGRDYQVPAGMAGVTFETFDADFAVSGRTRVIKFSPERNAHFRIEGNNMLFVSEGMIQVRNADVKTPHGTVRHKGTDYVIEITADSTYVAVADGKVTVTVKGGVSIALTEGEATIATADSKHLETIDGNPLLEMVLASVQQDADAVNADDGYPWWIHVPWIGLLCMIPIVVLAMRRKRRSNTPS